jgi:hypothetical protein
MSTKAGTMGFSGRPALFTFWTVAVSVLAAAALILSAVALNVAGRGDRSVTGVEGSGTRVAESNGSLDEGVVAQLPLNESLIIAYDRALRQRDRLLKEWDRPGGPAGSLDDGVVAQLPLKESLIIAYDRALRQRDRLLKEWDRPARSAVP